MSATIRKLIHWSGGIMGGSLAAAIAFKFQLSPIDGALIGFFFGACAQITLDMIMEH